MVKVAIILAGGLGLRLKEVVKDIPKSMANINERPFLEYLFDFLIGQGIEKAILSVGYRYEYIKNHFGNEYKNLKIEYCIEKNQLGTGGAIKYALESNNYFNNSEPVLILNGDTLFKINIKELYDFHILKNSELTLALKQMKNFERYGTVKIDNNGKIVGFDEKKFREQGIINCGVYILNPSVFNNKVFPEKFSFERNLMEKHYSAHNFFGLEFDEYFIDIGVPEDYERARRDFESISLI